MSHPGRFRRPFSLAGAVGVSGGAVLAVVGAMAGVVGQERAVVGRLGRFWLSGAVADLLSPHPKKKSPVNLGSNRSRQTLTGCAD